MQRNKIMKDKYDKYLILVVGDKSNYTSIILHRCIIIKYHKFNYINNNCFEVELTHSDIRLFVEPESLHDNINSVLEYIKELNDNSAEYKFD
jgi:hypothetical protein